MLENLSTLASQLAALAPLFWLMLGFIACALVFVLGMAALMGALNGISTAFDYLTAWTEHLGQILVRLVRRWHSSSRV